MKFLIIKLLIIVLLVNSCNSELFSINADKCTNLGCTFSSLFTSKIPKITDDVIFFTTNPLIQSIIILSDQISIKSLNVTNGILKIASSGSLTVASNILIAAGGSLMLDGSSTCNSLTLNGNLYVNSLSSLSVSGSLSIGSGVFESNGTLNIGTFNVDAAVTTYPKIFGNAVVTLKGDANINAGIQLLNSASLIVNNGVCTIKNLIASSTATIENRATLFLSNLVGDLVCKVNSIAGSIIKFENSKIHFHNILSTDTTSISLLGSTLTIHNIPTISLGVLSIDSTSNIILDKSNCTIASIKSSALGSIIKLTNSSNFNIDKSLDISIDLDIDPTSSINVVSTSSSQVVNFIGNIISAVNSIIRLDNSCVFNKAISLDSITLGPNAIVTFMKNCTIVKDLLCPSSAKIIIDKVSGSLTIGGNSNIDINVNLEGSAKLNIVASADVSVSNKLCTIKQITTSGDALLNIGTGVNVNILTPSIFGNPIQLNGNANLQLNGDVTLNGLTILPINNINLPTLTLSDGHCILAEGSDFDVIGTIKLIKSTLELSKNTIFNINNNLNCDPTSNVIIPVDSTLIVSGPSSIIESAIKVDGKLNIEKGSIKLNSGISSTINSFITCNNANVEINGKNVNIDGQFSITGVGSININALTTVFNNGIKCPTIKSPININAQSSVSINTDSLISSPVFCLGKSILNIASNSNVQFDGGLSSEIDATISLEGSTFSLNSTSNILGSLKLNNSTIISSGETKISNSISSDPSSVSNLMVNSGSCVINTKNNIDISGQVLVHKNSLLNINAAKTSCVKGLKNSGKLVLSSILDTGASIVSQISGDAEIVLLAGSNIISKASANLLSGKISGAGKITSDDCQCGGIINGMISIDGNLKLLDSAVVLVDIFSNTNYSKISCNGNVNVSGLIEVNLDSETSLNLKKGDIFSIIASSNTSIDGTLTLSDTTNSKSFTCEKSATGSTYNLVYQDVSQTSGKNEESDQDHASSSSKLYNSITLLLILIVSIII